MSEVQQGADWWLASDGRWYPPTSRPAPPTPFSAPPGSTPYQSPQPGAPYQYQYPPQGYVPWSLPQPTKTSGMAIASMVLGIVWVYWIGAVLAVIFGHVALSQIKKDPQVQGRGMAIAGLVLGYVWLGILALVIALVAAKQN